MLRSAFAALVVVGSLGVAAPVAWAAGDGKGAVARRLDASTQTAKAKKPAAFKTLKSRRGVAVGDVVATDASGFAVVEYGGGSFTRVGASSTYAVVEISKTGAVRGRLKSGEIWNEIEKATGSQTRFEVETPSGTATVRGTAFSVSCVNNAGCTFAVVEGVVEVALAGGPVTVNAGQQLVVNAAGASTGPQPLPSNVVWIQQNQDQDRAEGRTPPGGGGGIQAKAASAAPATIAQAIAQNPPAGTRFTSVQCDGPDRLQQGDVMHCTAQLPAGATESLRVVVLDNSGQVTYVSRKIAAPSAGTSTGGNSTGGGKGGASAPVDPCALLTPGDIASIFGRAVVQEGIDNGTGSAECRYEIADNTREDAFFDVEVTWPTSKAQADALAKERTATAKRQTTTVSGHPAIYDADESSLFVNTGDHAFKLRAQILIRGGYEPVEGQLVSAAELVVNRLKAQ